LLNDIYSSSDPLFPHPEQFMNWGDRTMLAPSSIPSGSDDVVEVPVLLPGWQFRLLETAASDSGRTTGQMMRTLISEFCSRQQLVGARD
jgi:hypothetical protein